ncbi:MAG: hypothetical protein JG774_1859 [Desulfomicrobiaceae bacterium]|jgi:hypothetical protein|nr:hypothetical protein [Desulfomicrobiaceae bacterium]
MTHMSLLWNLDPIFIWPFRLFPAGAFAFVAGCAVLAVGAVVLGNVASVLVKGLNRGWYQRQYEEMIRMHNLSVDAVAHGSKEAYLAANKEAMEAFGKYFFSQAGVFTVSLWPVPVILAWMDLRFRDAPLEILDWNISYFVVFLVVYIGVRLVVGPRLTFLGPYRRLCAWAEHRGGITPRHFEDIGKE